MGKLSRFIAGFLSLYLCVALGIPGVQRVSAASRSRTESQLYANLEAWREATLAVRKPARSAEADQGQTEIRTTLVRRSGSKNAEAIGQLADGTPVEVLDASGAWFRVDCCGMTGYIAAGQLELGPNDTYYVNCKEGSPDTRTMPYTPPEQALRLRTGLLALAREQLGTPYVYGGSRPGGFDCSGLMYYLYGQHGISLQRRASQQLADGIAVPREEMQVGDLVFFLLPWDTTPASHVGIYAGNNRIIHAGSAGIEYADLNQTWFFDYFLCVRRVVNTGAAAPESRTAADRTMPGARTVTARRTG